MIKNDIAIICVNYNTPDLIENLLNSWREYGYNNIPIFIIDGSDEPKFIDKIKDVCKIQNVSLIQFGYNIHHGPGLHQGINNSDYKYLFLIDSDSYFIKENLFDNIDMPENIFGIGRIVLTNEAGQNDKNGKVKYLHPNCCLINKEKYLLSDPLIKHGAPFINTILNMKFMIIDRWDIIQNYVSFGSRGTVNRFGYNLK